ncbi:MAG: aspartate kinase [Bdellovibrionaceae bacterium]|nr:aspartate kinase [Pseudobdellovibrionaceae bacterium]
MSVRVYKFGGASLSDIEKIKYVAQYLKKEQKTHSLPIIVVVSAMGKTTDEFIGLAQSVAVKPKRRELDMLLTSGERISMALLSLALNDLGVSAISLTGSQAGIITDSSHGNARIRATRPIRLEAHLQKGEVVVLAGFQGVSEQEKEVTTLGRGGSDTTAVAMAAHFKSSICDFKKDVGGVFSADPKIVPHAKHLPQLHFRHLMDMTFWGGKVLHYRAAELAGALHIPLRLSHFMRPVEQTIVSGENPMMEEQRILSINSHKNVHRVFFAKVSQEEILEQLFQHLKEKEVPFPQILASHSTEVGTRLLLTGEGQAADYQTLGSHRFEQLASVTLTCHGSVNSDLLPQILKHLNGTNIKIWEVLQDSTNLTLVVDRENREKAIQVLHTLI